MKLRNIIITVFACTISSSCSDNDEEKGMTEICVPLTVSANISGNDLTRADEKSEFIVGDKIGINAQQNGQNTPLRYEYKDIDGTYVWSPVDGTYYYRNVKDVTFVAYYPCDAQYTGVEAQDFLAATVTTNALTDGGKVKFNLEHKMSKLSFSFTKGSDITDSDVASISSFTLKGLSTIGTFDTSKGEASAIGSSTDVDVELPSTLKATQVVFPQTTTVTLSFRLNDILYTAELGKLTLEGGIMYNYTISVNKRDIVISDDITEWKQEADETSAADMYYHGSIKEVDDEGSVENYALAFNDGSFENVWNSKAVSDEIKLLSSFQLENICGIVFYLCDPTDDDSTLATDYPKCKHGLIVALSNVESDKFGYKSGSNVYKSRMVWSESTASISSVSYTDDTKEKVLGYSNTKKLNTYNSGKSDDAIVRPVYALKNEYGEAAPFRSSGWFIPSAYELSLLAKSRETLETILGEINGLCASHGVSKSIDTKFYNSNNNSNSTKYYWSSSESGDDATKACCVDFTSSNYSVSTTLKTDGKYNVRAICAF